jgi:hypothetical protein
MVKDITAILHGLVDKLKKRGHSEDDILRVVDAQGDVLVDKIADAIAGAARKPGDAYPLSVNYDLPLAEAVDTGKYQGVHSSITSQDFPSKRHGLAMLEIFLVRYHRRMTSEEVLSELDKEGLRPAELPEFLAFGAEYPEVQRQFSIIGLGSVWKDKKGYRNVPCLYEASEARYLDLHWWDDGWYSHCRFAALRK